MLLNIIFALFAFLVAPILASPFPGHPPILRITYSTQYDNKNLSLNGVACSNGQNGLVTKGYKTLGDLKNFPFIGGSQYVEGWNSANCGACYRLNSDYGDIYILAVDHAAEGFVLSKAAMDKLTNGQAANLGYMEAAIYSADASDCQF